MLASLSPRVLGQGHACRKTQAPGDIKPTGYLKEEENMNTNA